MMKNYKLRVIGALLLCALPTFAQYDATGETTEQVVQLRGRAYFRCQCGTAGN